MSEAEKKSVNGKLWVRKTVPVMGTATEEYHEEMIEVDAFQTQPAEAEVRLGMTINLGNYESARIDVGVRVPCYKEEVPSALVAAKQVCEDAIRKEIAQIKGKR